MEGWHMFNCGLWFNNLKMKKLPYQQMTNGQLINSNIIVDAT